MPKPCPSYLYHIIHFAVIGEAGIEPAFTRKISLSFVRQQKKPLALYYHCTTHQHPMCFTKFKVIPAVNTEFLDTLLQSRGMTSFRSRISLRPPSRHSISALPFLGSRIRNTPKVGFEPTRWLMRPTPSQFRITLSYHLTSVVATLFGLIGF